jgi:alpha-methylacyl-CoA racemase
MTGPAGHTGPLAGVRIVELAGLGPTPFACMLLADLGADVVRVDRPSTARAPGRPRDVVLRGRRSIVLDLKSDVGRGALGRLLERSDALCEGFRPGVLERLGFAPEVCWERNPRLVIARSTGWGQDGPRAGDVGHDVNYAAASGVLHAIGPRGGDPVIPVNIAADGGGGFMLALGIVCGVLEARSSGFGQVIDSAMVDASALLMAKWYGELAESDWRDERGVNRVDGGSHYYNVYRTADGRYLSVGAIEPQFYAALLEQLDLSQAELPGQNDRSGWSAMTQRFAEIFATRTLADWMARFEGHDVCVAPVLSLSDAPHDAHLQARGTFETIDGIVQPAAAPRFSRTPARAGPIATLGQDTEAVLAELDQPVPAGPLNSSGK